MLTELRIDNLAVIESADIEFALGLNVLTGETGAGKSIVIDAISAIMGARVGREIVRSGCKSALISGVLDMTDAARVWLEENDLEPEDQLILQRRVSEDGKSTCRVNGAPVSVAQLRELGELLFDIHGQNDGAGLLREAGHLAYLDGFGELTGKKSEVAELYRRWRQAMEALEELKAAEQDKERRENELRARIEELSEANPKEGEEEALTERRALLRNAGRLTGRLDAAYQALYGDESSDGAVTLLDEATASLTAAAKIADGVASIAKTAEQLRYALRDLTEELADMRSSLDFSPGELERIEERLGVLNRLSRKYGSVADMGKLLQDSKNELEDVEYLTERVAEAERDAEKRREALTQAAAKLTLLRKAAAEKLRDQIVSELGDLSMPGVRFEAEITPKQPDATGADTVRFLMSANAGEQLGRISKIASGGELSRIMLAMKAVLARDDSSQVLIFDEIDTGVSGIAAQRVGEKLAKLSRGRQVLCVTHLPQIAAMADSQFSVEKSESGGRTFAVASRLDGEGRRRELARLIGGENVGESTLRGAGEQLEAAEKFKMELDT